MYFGLSLTYRNKNKSLNLDSQPTLEAGLTYEILKNLYKDICNDKSTALQAPDQDHKTPMQEEVTSSGSALEQTYEENILTQ